MRPACHTEHTAAPTSPKRGTHASRLASLTAALAIALALSLCGTALGAPMPSSVDSEAFSQSPGPVTTYPHAPAAAVSPRADSNTLAAPSVSSNDGLGTLAIVLITAGGALALAGVAYTTTRVVHHRHEQAVS